MFEESFLYFAYGSNTLTKRIQHRCNSATKITNGVLNNYAVNFSKKSNDGSGKATIYSCDKSQVFGVVFKLSSSDSVSLDKAEGKGYLRQEIEVTALSGEILSNVVTYLAKDCSANIYPYDWYLALIICGFREHDCKTDAFEKQPFNVDSDLTRQTRQDAIAQLVKAGFSKWNEFLPKSVDLL